VIGAIRVYSHSLNLYGTRRITKPQTGGFIFSEYGGVGNRDAGCFAFDPPAARAELVKGLPGRDDVAACVNFIHYLDAHDANVGSSPSTFLQEFSPAFCSSAPPTFPSARWRAPRFERCNDIAEQTAF